MFRNICVDNHPSDLRDRKVEAAMNRNYSDNDFKNIFPEVEVWEDGLYVDVSFKETMTLGFALVREGTHFQFSLPSNHNCTYQAELEAIAVGRRLFPGVTVFSDHYDAAELVGATYIPRERNKLAHYAAKHRRNYRWVPDLDFAKFAEMVEQCGLRAIKLHEKQWQVRSSLTCGIAVTWAPFSRTKIAMVTGDGRKRDYKFCSADKVIEIAKRVFHAHVPGSH